jgi:hypothetical protein
MAKANVYFLTKQKKMKDYQQMSLSDSSRGSYVPKVQVSLVKEVYLRNSDREKFICIL